MTYQWKPGPIPPERLWQIKEGSKGEEVAVLQLNLGLTIDGEAGPATDRAIRQYQNRVMGLEKPIGVAGPLTQRSIIETTSRAAEEAWSLPERTLLSLSMKETDGALAAWSDHPAANDWGFDLGAFQNSVGPQGDAATQSIFAHSYDVEEMAEEVAEDLAERFSRYRREPKVESASWYGKACALPRGYRGWIFARQLALFGHNLPAMADCIAKRGSCYEDPAADDRFNSVIWEASGHRLSTMRQWAHDYIIRASALVDY